MASSVFISKTSNFDVECFPSNLLCWSTHDPIAAVPAYSFDDNNNRETYQILFVNHEGVAMPNLSIEHSAEATAIDWQPNGKVLAVGWADGMVSCFIVDGKSKSSLYSNSSIHNDQITLVKWNPVGKRLITGDKRGLVCVWTADARGVLTPTRQYRKKGAITTAVFCVLPVRIENSRKSEMKNTYSPPFFFGTDQGVCVYADDLGHSTEVNQSQSPVDILMFFEEKARLVIINRSMMLTQYQVADDGKTNRLIQLKLSVSADLTERGLRSVVWSAPGLIAFASQEKLVRLLDLAADESYNLPLSALGAIMEKTDVVNCVAFSSTNRLLAVGTKLGFIVIWKYNGPIRDLSNKNGSNIPSSSQNDWELFYRTQCQGAVHQMEWYKGSVGRLGAVTEDGVVVLTELVMQRAMSGSLVVVQTANEDVQLTSPGSKDVQLCQTGILVKGIAASETAFVVWNGDMARTFRVHDINNIKPEPMEVFNTHATAIAIAGEGHLSDEAIFLADKSMIQIANFGGVQRSSITFSEAEGQPKFLDLNGRFLATVTDKDVIGIYNVQTPNKPKPVGSTGKFADSSITSNLAIRQIKVNSDGTRVAILADVVEGAIQVRHNDSKLYVYDRNKGTIHSFDFNPWRRCPSNIYWDSDDNRMLAVEAVRNRSIVSTTYSNVAGNNNKDDKDSLDKSKNNNDSEADVEYEIFMLFTSSEHGIIMQDSFPRRNPFGPLLGLVVPRLYFVNAAPAADSDTPDQHSHDDKIRIFSKVMRDFVGMEEVDPNTKQGLLDFSFNLTLGKLDEAYRAVKTIGSPALWENMAQMCVKTKRLDVAEVCLGHMGNARGAAAVRLAKKENSSIDAIIGILAIQLGLLDEASRLFRESGRFDLLNKLYQAAGLWDKAIQIANTQDRLHLKTTHFEYGRYLESLGDVDKAIEHYEISETYRAEVPRMLFALGKIEELEDYIHQSDDRDLLKWWAAYLESNNRFDSARKYYNKAGDYLSLVRILCFKGDFNKAAEIIHETNDRAASYHFARQLENQGEYQEAITFYATAGCFNHCIRLARAYGLDAELMRYALKSTTTLMIESATHFEHKGEFDKAVQLYHKGGDLPRALDLCFRAAETNPAQSKVMFDMLNTIAQDLGAETSPQTLARCAEFLVNHSQFEKAIDLYIMAKRYMQAIDMCLQHRVNISDAMAERLTPPETMDLSERKELLKELAKALKKQGSFTLASKKYTQAGDRIRAIKCLVRGGDTKAVMQFATISRNSEIYTLAANYLQQMNWREHVDIMKTIIMFYTKAKAFEQLAGFYDSCAQVEIDEYRDYEKAIAALGEALKYASKVETRGALDLASSIEKRIALIKKFVEAKKLEKRDPEGMVQICESLLQQPMIEDAIRSGDCYAMLIEFYHSRGQLKEAYQYLQEMEDRRIPLHPYVDGAIIDQVFKAVGGGSRSNKGGNNRGPSSSSSGNNNNRHDDDEDEVDEEIGEEIDEEEEVRPSPPKRGNSYGRK